MSVRLTCDRCGKECGHVFSIAFAHRGPLGDLDVDNYDLCHYCADQFTDFMKGTKPTTLRELLIETFKRKD